MKLARLWQPRNPAFWLMVVLNLLSTLLAWVTRTYALAPLAMLVVTGFAIGNALLGLRLMWLLVQDEPTRRKAMAKSIQFFETQFRSQVASNELALNPFEIAALPHLRGRVLDFGCGLGNLAVAAARQGCSVMALDAAPTAIQHLASLAKREGLDIRALEADLREYEINEDFDTVVSIGLLMFFDRETARRQLAQMQARVRPGGVAVINVLKAGTTFLDLFDPGGHCLFEKDELRAAFADWEVLGESLDDYPAPGETIKSFITLIARKPGTPAA